MLGGVNGEHLSEDMVIKAWRHPGEVLSEGRMFRAEDVDPQGP